jgi:hypothetical protein
MQQTNLNFPDGLALSLYSMRAQNLSVQKNERPSASGDFVTALDTASMVLGSGFWTSINHYSWSMKFVERDVNGA